jgi:hypothetical protein
VTYADGIAHGMALGVVAVLAVTAIAALLARVFFGGER